MTDKELKASITRETKQAINQAKTMQTFFKTYFKVEPLKNNKKKEK